MPYVFNQSTGDFLHDAQHLAVGYAGHPPNVNRPSAQSIPNEGPIPQGLYNIGPQFTHPTAGPVVMRLTPFPTNKMFGRDGFLIHGDTPAMDYTASNGCIVLPRATRALIASSGDTVLQVISGLPAQPPSPEDYAALWAEAVVNPTTQLPDIPHDPRYDEVSALTNVPWWFIAAIHYREASLDFTCHLHNGDPLTDRTVNVPAGRPLSPEPPYTWVYSAVDAFNVAGLTATTATPWDIPTALAHAERYNGMGYARQSPPIPSPYLWGQTSVQQPGKYVRDGVFDPTVMDDQLGVAAIWKGLNIQ